MQSSRESSHAYTKNAGEQCSSIGRVTAPYKICHSLKCGCFTWIHTFAALIAPHYLDLPPGVIPWYFAAMLHYLKLFFKYVCSMFLQLALFEIFPCQLNIQQLARWPAIIHFLHLCSPLELHWSKPNSTAAGLAPFHGHVLVNLLQPAMLTKIHIKHITNIQHLKK